MIYHLTVTGKDKIGLVEALAEQVQQRGGNWLESRLCRLGGRFAGIVRVEFASAPESLPDKVESLACLWEHVPEEESAEARDGTSAKIHILAADRPGLVKQISRLLASAGANVEEVESRVRSAPFSGEQMFEANYVITLPPGGDRAALGRQLESLAEELMCDIELEDALEAANR